jgi:PAS domain S-box-containing protein
VQRDGARGAALEQSQREPASNDERLQRTEEALKQTRQALRQSEERLGKQSELLAAADGRFRAMADAAALLIRLSGADHRCTYFNRPWLDFTGQTVEQAFAEWQEAIHPADRADCIARLATAVERRESVVLEYRLRRADGVYRWVADHSEPIQLPSGEFDGYISSCLDIDDQKRVEERLREAADFLAQKREWLEAVLNLLPMPMLLFDTASGDVSFSNQAARQTLDVFAGTPLQANRATTLNDASGKPLAESDRPLARVARGERLNATEIQVHGPRGLRSLVVNSEFLPAMHSGHRMAVVVFQDITNQKRIEADLRRHNQAKDSLLAMLGHELRNPLAAITSAAELIELLDAADPEVENAREVLQNQIQHLVQLVDDMLDVSRLMKGKIRIRRELLDVREIVHQSLQTCEIAIEGRRHTVDVQLPTETMPVEGDAARLEQVFVNLLTNAAKYTEPGGRIAVIGTTTRSECIVRVRDNGIGIPPELLPQVFELFRQLSPSTHRAEGGLGIGLNIVKNLVELHGGSVAVHSEGPGCGSEFSIRLPRKDPERRPALPPSIPRHVEHRQPNALRMMVVEDNVDIAHSVRALLRHLGHDVVVAEEGVQALALAQGFRPELALIDIGLPGMSGLELASAFRRDPKLRSTYLIALTGFGQEDDRKRSLSAGFNEHVVKPVSMSRLQLLIAQSQTGQADIAPPASEYGLADNQCGNQQNDKQGQE